MAGKRASTEAGRELAKRQTTKDWRQLPPRMSGGDGSLRSAIQNHAFERARHFFLFMAQLDMTCYEHNRTDPANPVDPGQAIRLAATHQTDSGYKDDRWSSGQLEWNRSASQIDDPASAFGQQDAAHFANIGIAPDASVKFGGNTGSPVIAQMKRELENIHGNTKLMPKTYNVTTDAVIDEVHFDKAKQFIATAQSSGTPGNLYLTRNGQRYEKNWKPFASGTNLNDYITGAQKKLSERRDAYQAKGRATEADCCTAYIDALNHDDFRHEVFSQLHANIAGEAIQYVGSIDAEAGPGGPAGLFFTMS